MSIVGTIKIIANKEQTTQPSSWLLSPVINPMKVQTRDHIDKKENTTAKLI